MRVHSRRRLADLFCLALACFALLPPAMAAADEAPPSAAEFQLDVSINGQPTGLVARFADLGDGRFASPASELRELGVKVPDEMPDGQLVPLDGFRGVSYVYDEQKQAIALELDDEHRVRKSYDARGEGSQAKLSTTDWGAVLNYSVFGSTGGEDFISTTGTGSFSGLNTTLDARVISPLGILSQTGIVGMTLADETQGLRLETTYTFSDEDNLVTWRGGDFISGGIGWSRPIRMGGVQAQRSFTMRPDLVTAPLPSVSGSAAVPSTVDVFVNGIKSYSKEVAAGPYQIDNVPSISGSGVAQVVTRDAAGREVLQTLSFYTSPRLLKPGLYDFSVEAGAPRLSYGIDSFNYDESIAGSATVRTGITDWLTGEAHTEGSDSLINGGAGFVASAFDAAIVSAAISASFSDQESGTQLYAAFETKIGPVAINARAQHAFGGYQDLASLTARSDTSRFGNTTFIAPGFSGGLLSRAPPRAIDSITLSMPIEFDKSSISATFLRYEPETGDGSEIVTATYSRPLPYNASMFATGFLDLNDKDSSGVYLGVSMPLDDNVSAGGGTSHRNGEITGYAEATKPLSQETGSWGWRIRDDEGTTAHRSAALAHRTSAARLEATVRQDQSGVRGTAEIDGAFALLGGDIYMSNRIEDSFAVVDAQAPGIKVQRENLLVGVTNEDGKILIPNLNAFQKNKVSIDPMDLPLNAEVSSTFDYVAPSYKSGVYVKFDIKKATPSALVILIDAAGAFLPAGSEGRLEGSDEPFVVGYDGQAFIKNLGAVNAIRVTADGRECSAQFAFAPTDLVQPVIGPEICQ